MEYLLTIDSPTFNRIADRIWRLAQKTAKNPGDRRRVVKVNYAPPAERTDLLQ